MNKIGEYKNGNYSVEMYDDGTKIRETDNNKFIPKYPESIDLKITNRCNIGCSWCHEQSSINGRHADIMNLDFIDTLQSYTEVAIGGGNVLSHPDLIPFLYKLKEKGIIANITVNQEHFDKNVRTISSLTKRNLIKGLGVSLTDINSNILYKIQQFSNAVIHVVNGIVDPDELVKLYNKDLKVLILGYKQFGRGKNYFSDDIKRRMDYLSNIILDIMKEFKVISFDNLAIEQLQLKDKLPEHVWDQFYMGDEGQFTMYIDAVEEQFGISSTSEKRYNLKNDIKDMFDVVRSDSNGI